MTAIQGQPDNVNNTTLELQRDLAHCTPRQCVILTHSVPSVQMYYALKSKIDNCSEKWLQEFLDLDGLDSLLDSLDQIAGRGFSSFSDAILQLDCIACIRAILNYSRGLEFFISSDLYTKKLTMALNSSDTLPKKQVYEVLAAVCAYSNIGYLRAMEGLSYVKSECDQLHRFSIMVNDLQRSETVAHKTSIFTFINCIINCTPDVTERIRIRNEFVGLNLLDVLTYIRKEEPDEDLLLQLEVFHERKLADEESVNSENNLDFNSPQDLLDQIQSRVFGTTRMANFVNILQDLLSVETVHSENNQKIWQALDGLVHHIVHTLDSPALDNLQSELQKLPEQLDLGLQCLRSYRSHRSLSSLTAKCPPCHQTRGHNKHQDVYIAKNYNCQNNQEDDTSCHSNQSDNKKNSMVSGPCANNAEKQLSGSPIVLPEKCGDRCNQSSQSNQNHSHQGSSSSLETTVVKKSGNVTSSPNISSHVNKSSDNTLKKNVYDNNLNKTDSQLEKSSFDQEKVPELFEHRSGSLSVNQCKPHATTVAGRSFHSQSGLTENIPVTNVKNINESCSDNNETCSTTILKHHSVARQPVPSPKKPVAGLKWVTLDDGRIVVCDQCVWMSPVPDQIQPDYGRLETMFQTVQREQTLEEVVLLNANTRLNINLFLSRLDSGPEELVESIQEGNQSELTLAMLRYLHKILPCPEEVKMLRLYKGSRLELGMAEQFVLLLSDLPDYTVLLEGHLIRAEFEATTAEFKASLTVMIDVTKVVLNNPHLKKLLHLILNIGNFLNNGMFNGDAIGFKLSTLQRLQEVKSTSPSKTLLHHLVQLVSEEDDKLLAAFVKDLLPLEKASGCSVEDMKGKISKLNFRLRGFIKKLTSAGTKVQAVFEPFVETLKLEYGEIQQGTMELRSLSDQLADYFCEEGTDFNIHDCLQCLLDFYREIKTCRIENLTLTRQTQLARKKGDALQKRLKNKLLSLEFGENAGASSSMMEDRPHLLEKMLNQLHRGSFHPFTKTGETTHDPELQPLEMSCIPHDGSPSHTRGRLGTNSDSVFLETPELAGVPVSRVAGMSRSSTLKMRPVTAVCTAQTASGTEKPEFQTSTLARQSWNSTRPRVPLFQPELLDTNPNTGTIKELNNKPRQKLFQLEEDESCKTTEVQSSNEKPQKRHIELPRRHSNHRRSKSDLSDSICSVDKWMKYEDIRNTEVQDKSKAPIAKPESLFNISTLNLESKGKFLTDKELQRYVPTHHIHHDDVCVLQDGPVIKVPESKEQKKIEKKSSVGGFFSKIGRAVLRPRNVYSDGDQYGNFRRSDVGRKSKKSFTGVPDKENIDIELMPTSDRVFDRNDKKYKSDQGRVSRFFQRGGIYRSSRMKGKKESI